MNILNDAEWQQELRNREASEQSEHNPLDMETMREQDTQTMRSFDRAYSDLDDMDYYEWRFEAAGLSPEQINRTLTDLFALNQK